LAWPFQSDLLRKSGSFQAASAAFPAVIIIGSCSECFLLYKRWGIFSEAAKVWIFQKKIGRFNKIRDSRYVDMAQKFFQNMDRNIGWARILLITWLAGKTWLNISSSLGSIPHFSGLNKHCLFVLLVPHIIAIEIHSDHKLLDCPATPLGGFLKWWYHQITHFDRIFHNCNPNYFGGTPIYGPPHLYRKVRCSVPMASTG
jgi:hypothetical protein